MKLKYLVSSHADLGKFQSQRSISKAYAHEVQEEAYASLTVLITPIESIELCTMEEDVSSAEAPLMRQESFETLHEPDDGEPREQDLTSPSWFIWALTFSAGISGLLFGYE